MKTFTGKDILLNHQLDHPGWLLKDFWIYGSKGFVAGPPKSMKSMLVMDFAFSVATGAPFFGNSMGRDTCTVGYDIKVNRNHKVLYIQREMPLWLIRDRLAKMCDAKKIISQPLKAAKGGIYTFDFDSVIGDELQNFHFTDPDESFNASDINLLVSEIEPDLIVVDPLYTFTNSDMIKNSEVQPILRWLDGLTKKTKDGCSKPALIVIHHTAKPLEKNKKTVMTPVNLLGSTFLHGWAECLWMLTPTNPNQVMLVREFRADQSPPNVLIDFNIDKPGDWGYSLR